MDDALRDSLGDGPGCVTNIEGAAWTVGKLQTLNGVAVHSRTTCLDVLGCIARLPSIQHYEAVRANSSETQD